MSPSHELPDSLLDLIYDAATDDDLWAEALTGIADLTGSEGGALFGLDRKKQVVAFKHLGRLSPDAQESFEARHFVNPWSAYMFNQPAGAVVSSDHVLPLHELDRTQFYQEVLRPQNIAHNAMIPIAKKGQVIGAFNMCRSLDQGPFEAADMRLVARLVPHLQRSFALGCKLDGYRMLQSAAFETLDHLSSGVVLLDQADGIVFANATAQALSTNGGPLLIRRGKLESPSPASARRLDELLRAARLGLPIGAMSVPHPADGRLVTVMVSSVRGHDLDRFASAGARDAAAIVFIFDPAAVGGIPAERLMDAYGLTLAEARVALHAALGRTVPDTAIRLNISPNTVKTHMRRIFAKTGTSRQAELTGLIATIGAVTDALP